MQLVAVFGLFVVACWLVRFYSLDHHTMKLSQIACCMWLAATAAAGYGQEVAINDSTSTINKIDTLPANIFTKLQNREFTTVVTGQGGLLPGTYASFQTKDKKLDFAGSWVRKNRPHVFTVKVNAGIQDGFAAIYTNEDLNAGVRLMGEYAFLAKKRKGALSYYTSDLRAYNKAKKVSKSAHSAALNRKTLNIKKHDALVARLQTDRKRLAAHEKLLAAIDNAPSKESVSCEAATLSAQAQALHLRSETERLKRTIHVLDSIRQALDTTALNSTEQLAANNTLFEANDKALADMKIVGYNLAWWSVGVGVGYDDFNLFNGTDTFPKQVWDTNFYSVQATVQRTWFNLTSDNFKTYYFALGATGWYAHNLEDLSTTTLEEVTEHGPNSGDRRSVKKTEVYSAAAYKRNLWKAQVRGDLYYFFTPDKRLGVHINPTGNFSIGQLPIWNCWLGLVGEFKKKDDTKSAVNIELAYNIADFFGVTSGRDTDLTDKRTIGINVAIPITFKSN